MNESKEKRRRVIGVAAAFATGMQCTVGLGKQLYFACTEGTQSLSFFLFFSTCVGMGLWAYWAFLKPGRPELIIAVPNSLGAAIALGICIVIGISNVGAATLNVRSVTTKPRVTETFPTGGIENRTTTNFRLTNKHAM